MLTVGSVTANIVCFHLPPALAENPAQTLRNTRTVSTPFAGLSSQQIAQNMENSPSLAGQIPMGLAGALMPPREYLLRRLNANMTLDAYRKRMDGEFRFANGDAKGEISAADGALLDQMAAANFRAMYLAQLLPADLDGDGVITEDEFRRWWTYRMYSSGAKPPEGKTLEETIEDKVRETMAIDTNHDGRITFAEALHQTASLPKPLGGLVVYQLLTLAPDGKTVLTRADFETAVEKLFHDVDSNGDGVVSADELQNYRASQGRNPPH
jgi:Ca2+-binding EF-hand superfamily protein